jgi:hypothetical protein
LYFSRTSGDTIRWSGQGTYIEKTAFI